jgi:cell division protein FtsL
MNTEVRFLSIENISTLPRVLVKPISFDFALPELRVLILFTTILISLLGIVYIKDLNRRLFINLETTQTQNESLRAYQNKLALEKSALNSPTRVQKIAQNLGLEIPDNHDIVLLEPDVNFTSGINLAYKNN